MTGRGAAILRRAASVIADSARDREKQGLYRKGREERKGGTAETLANLGPAGMRHDKCFGILVDG